MWSFQESEFYGHLLDAHHSTLLYFCKACNLGSTKGRMIAEHVAGNKCRMDRDNPVGLDFRGRGVYGNRRLLGLSEKTY